MCNDSDGKSHSLCYALPSNGSVGGRRFDCASTRHLGRLGLLDDAAVVDLSSTHVAQAVFVAAASESHLAETLHMIATLRARDPSARVLFFDLGLDDESVVQLQSLCGVHYRRFDFARYPAGVSQLSDYRWKPLVIAEALLEFSAIWWLDSSVQWQGGHVDQVLDLLRCRAYSPATAASGSASSTRQAVSDELSEDELPFDFLKWRRAVRRCDKFPLLLHAWTGHGIYSATHPGMYDFLPVEAEKVRGSAAKMYEAGLILLVRTREVVNAVLKWWVLCALEDDCLAPPGAQLGCDFGADKFAQYAHCHRFDQSALNILLANANNYRHYYYTSQIVDFFQIVRHVQGSVPNRCR